MSIILNLFRADLAFLAHWFKKQTLTKLFILFAFLALFLFISTFAYFTSIAFFRNLLSFGVYGSITILYILAGALVIGIWLAIVSGFVSTLTFLLNPSNEIDLLTTLPIEPFYLSFWFGLKSFLANLLLFTVVVFPFALSFQTTINYFPLQKFLLWYGLLALSFSSLSLAIGGIGAQVGAVFVKNRPLLSVFFGSAFFILATVLLFRLIFPNNLFLLYSSSADDFFAVYKAMPLVKIFSVFSTILIKQRDYMTIFLISALCILVFFLSIILLSKNLIAVFQNTRVYKSRKDKRIATNTFLLYKNPLVVKDILSVIRIKEELGYALFLLLLFIFFLLFTINTISVRKNLDFYKTEIIANAFVWCLFFSSAFLLRIVFPLMAREGKTAWSIFTLPINRTKILLSKIETGLVLSLPLLFLSFGFWLTFPPLLNPYLSLLLSFLAVISVFLLALLTGIAGIIFPNFQQSEQPEKASTSPVGLAAALLCIAYSVLLGIAVFWYLQNKLSFLPIILVILLFSTFIIAPLLYIALKLGRDFEF